MKKETKYNLTILGYTLLIVFNGLLLLSVLLTVFFP